MIDNMASLKQAMEQMDADDMAASQAAKDRAAQILSHSGLNFSKIAELIEQRRLLLRPRIVASIKRMDQPEMLGDAAFRDAGTALRREGQSFRLIAEALEVNRATGTRTEDTAPRGEVLQHPMEIENEPDGPAWPRRLTYAMRVAFFPLRHPIRFLMIVLLAVVVYNAWHDSGRQVSGYVANVSATRQQADAIASWVSSFFRKPKRPSQDAASPPTPPAPIPSPSSTVASSPSAMPAAGPTVASGPPAATPAPQASATAPPANEAVAPASPPASPPASTPRPDVRNAPSSTVASNSRLRTAVPRPFDDLMPTGLRRNSRSGGPCVAGAGGCYWGGARY